MKQIDLRSDTVTLPSPEMRKAIAAAEVGDDVFAEDPTVNRLQEMAAEMLGKEAGLLVSSGTQGNLIAQMTHCPRGAEVIIGEGSHIIEHEGGGAWLVGGLGLHTVPIDSKGRLDLAAVRATIRPDNEHYPRTGLICVENTHNRAGGTVQNEEDLAAVRELADKHKLPVHMDGARIFNAAVKLGVPASNLTAYADSVTFCLSKGLGAPIGSVLCGSRDFIHEAHRMRKVLGGGTRQAGFIAAAGIYALENMIDRLAEDHDNAQRAAAGLAEMPGVTLAPPPETNLLYFTVDSWKSHKLEAKLNAAGVRCFDEGGRIRWVTHFGIEATDIEEALDITRGVLAAGA
ncbi:MAG: low-specificity L-threonine aldolase [Chloroflexota bacterium]